MFQVPRTLPEIQAEYNSLCGALGQTEFRLSLLQKESAKLRESLMSLDTEAGERNKMDAKAQQDSAREDAKVVEITQQANSQDK